MLGVAIRIAQRMGIHTESTYARFTVLKAETCRRLWWSLVIFDNRICEMFDYKMATLTPFWDCKPPVNVNDFEILPGDDDTAAGDLREAHRSALYSSA